MAVPGIASVPSARYSGSGRFAAVVSRLGYGHFMVSRLRGFCRGRAALVACNAPFSGLCMTDLHHGHFGRHGIAHPAAQGQQGDHQGEKEKAHWRLTVCGLKSSLKKDHYTHKSYLISAVE